MLKTIGRMLGLWVLAEVLTLFLNLTLAFSGTVFRIVSAVCTVGILLALTAQGGISAAKDDKKAKRHSGANSVIAGIAAMLVPVLLTMLLALSRAGVVGDGFYRWYKLLCAPFLSVCNLLSDDVVTSSLPGFGIPVLSVLCLLPGISAALAYRITAGDRSIDEVMY